MKKTDRDNIRRRKSLMVVSSKGVRQRFLRGMITHDLVQRGLSFDDGYAAAHAIRDRLAERDEVTTEEIRDLIQQHLESTFGTDLPTYLQEPVKPVPERFVLKDGQKQPFSRGLLARSIYAAGLDLDRAYRLVAELEQELRESGITISTSRDVARRVAELLERFEGPQAARRYWLMRRIHQLPRPLAIYLGGASGTGKSTLALELAPLLRIYRIISTDTIRQMMRMVFSPQILPELHSSSFELVPPSGQEPWAEDLRVSPDDPESIQRLNDTFLEQATRVAVGVRAVVDRAIAENVSLLIEGVHLCPPLVPFADLEDAIEQVPIVLATPDLETHQARFLSRARHGGRRAERYLQNLDAIRAVQDFVLHQAETHDIPLLDTSFEDPARRTLRLITGILQRRLPKLTPPGGPEPSEVIPTLLLVIDGLADRPVSSLGGQTPLQAAKTPVLDRLAREGQCGLADPVAPGVVPDTAAGSLALFGQPPLALKRGPIEALGAGIRLLPGDIALRGNFATLDGKKRLVDRRAGRIRDQTDELAQALDRLPLPGRQADEIEVRVKSATEHRLAIVLRGEGLSPAILGSDPGDDEGTAAPPPVPRPIDTKNEEAIETAQILALFEQKARRVLNKHPVNRARQAEGLPPANVILTRGAGRIRQLDPLEQAGIPLRMTCVSGDRTVLGLAELLGGTTVRRDGMTANLDTDLEAKFDAASLALKRNDLVILHVKGADVAAHDRRPDLKLAFLEKIDQALGNFLERRPKKLRIAVAADHATLSESGRHAADPLPVLIWGHGIEADEVEAFDEASALDGELQQFPLQMLLERLYEPD